MLASIGAVLGIPLAHVLTGALRGWGSLAVPLLHQVQVDGAALVFTAAVATLSGLVFGAVPAIRVATRPPQEALRAQGRGTTEGRQHARMRSALVVSEIALASVLLVGAGLLLRSFIQILDVELGFRPAQAAAMRIDVRAPLEGDEAAARQAPAARLAAAARRVGELQGVEAAGLTDALPLDRDRSWSVGVPGRAFPRDETPTAFVYITGPGYLRAMGIPLRDGRDFSDHDTPSNPRVAIVNEALAEWLYPDQAALGREVTVNGTPYTIVGIAAPVRQGRLDERPVPQMYLPFAYGFGVSSELIVRSSRPLASLAADVRNALAALDSTLLVTDVRPIADLVDRAVSPRRFLVTLIAGFSALALLLASLGIYGVVAYTVSQRVQEIGVRMALGATPGAVRRRVLGDTLRLSIAGILAGLVASLGVARLMAALLFETSPSDPAVFASSAALLVAVAILAGYIPAHRASRVDPMTALRAE